jgi:hypothetical protein
MKEQALPDIATRYDVRVLARRRPTGLPIRSLEDYIQALRYHHRRKSGTRVAVEPLAEDWNATFSLIEPGAQVDPASRVHDSVVLKDAVVEAGAVLVRSVVCPGGVLRRDKTAVETFVTAVPETRRMRRGRGFPVVARAGGARGPAVTAAPTSSDGDVVS